MDSSYHAKLYVGGLLKDTNANKLKEHFSKYGEVKDYFITPNRFTGSGKKIGFVIFTDPSMVDAALKDDRVIDGREVEVKPPIPKGYKPEPNRSNNNHAMGGDGGKKRIFVGGLPPVTEVELKAYFEAYGKVLDATVIHDRGTGKSRGFGFIKFDSELAVEKVLQKRFHVLKDKMVEVKMAEPKGWNGNQNVYNPGWHNYGSDYYYPTTESGDMYSPFVTESTNMCSPYVYVPPPLYDYVYNPAYGCYGWWYPSQPVPSTGGYFVPSSFCRSDVNGASTSGWASDMRHGAWATDFANEAANLAGYPNSSRAIPEANCNSMSCGSGAQTLLAGYENGNNEDYHVKVNSNTSEIKKSTKTEDPTNDLSNNFKELVTSDKKDCSDGDKDSTVYYKTGRS